MDEAQELILCLELSLFRQSSFLSSSMITSHTFLPLTIFRIYLLNYPMITLHIFYPSGLKQRFLSPTIIFFVICLDFIDIK